MSKAADAELGQFERSGKGLTAGVSELLVQEMIQEVQFGKPHTFFQAFERQVVLVVKILPANSAKDKTDAGSIPGWERYPREGNGNPLQYSCLEDSMERVARWAPVHRLQSHT